MTALIIYYTIGILCSLLETKMIFDLSKDKIHNKVICYIIFVLWWLPFYMLCIAFTLKGCIEVIHIRIKARREAIKELKTEEHKEN